MSEAIQFLSDEQTAQFQRDGYIVVRGLFSPAETATIRDHFMAIHAAGPVAGYFDPVLYFKPPGARGQALHQDNFYLRVSPGTCLAAWLSLDDADEENGGMFVVPGSHVTGV